MADNTPDKLAGRTVWIPRMSYVSARLTAAVFRSQGIDARPTPPSDSQTLELGGLFTGGEECYPEKVTLGDFLRIVQASDFDPTRHAFFMPTADGPCRFGQYAPYLRRVLDELGHSDVPVLSPTSANSYEGMGGNSLDMIRQLWRGIVAGDILRKMLLRTRPYETQAGAADAVYAESIEALAAVLEKPGMRSGARLKALAKALTAARDKYRAVPAKYTKDRPLIGIVGEIFCRLNTFSNSEAIRKIEAHGGEAWISDVSEWVWYTNWSQKDGLLRDGKKYSLKMLGANVKNAVQHADERALLKPFADDFTGYEEPHDLYHDVLKPGWPYLPADGALGEMALSVGKSVYLYDKGADGIIDISPFSCMNGIVSEAVYHAVSREHDGMPIRNFYFDAATTNMERDLEIFMELARGYQKRKTRTRRYGKVFDLEVR